MRSVASSLKFRLFSAFVLVIFVSVGTIAVFLTRTTNSEINEYEELTERLEMTRLEHWLLGYHAARGGWDGLHPLVGEMSVLFGGTIVVADAAGNIVADSRTAVPSLEAPAETELPEREIPIGRIGESVGILYVDSAPGIGTSYSEALADSLDLFLVWGSMLAAVVALILTMVLSRRIAAPVEELAAFARRAGRGDL
ncbi:MAG: hypothetical protein R6V29_09915, partial [Spirochaetia bacterium]